MFASIIAAVEPGEAATRAVGAAALIAREADCPLVLAHVATPGSPEDRGWLADLAANAEAPSCTILTLTHDRAASGLLELQAEHPDSLLCLATQSRAGVGEMLFGSTAAEVIRHTPHPVVLVGPTAEVPDAISTIQVCVDGSEESEAGAASAAVWALLLHARLHLVRVAPPSVPGEPYDRVTDLEALAADLRRNIAVHAEWELLHADHPAAALVDYARSLPASLVVVTTSPRADAIERLLGSTAARVTRDAPCPVLVVRRHPRR